jgi:hypothetical protein
MPERTSQPHASGFLVAVLRVVTVEGHVHVLAAHHLQGLQHLEYLCVQLVLWCVSWDTVASARHDGQHDVTLHY